MGRRGFWRELKRRHVYRVAASYVVVGWLLIQVVTQVFPIFHLPDWIDQAIVLLILVGFPIALVLAWAFDATPQGIVRTDAQGGAGVQTSPRSDRAGIMVGLIGLLLAVIAGAGWWHGKRGGQAVSAAHDVAAAVSVATPSVASTAAGAAAAEPRVIPALSVATLPIPAKSIAVLPFENLSEDKGNAYFADGMQDLILTKLADIGDLKVISRTSTMKYASHPDDLKTIAQQLGVATILEGSVQKAGNQVLINVQLIDAHTDSHRWAESYTRTLDNVFGVEGEVAQKIAEALKAKLSPTESQRLDTALSANPDANDLFLRAENFIRRGSVSYGAASFLAAIPLYRQALAKDKNFVLARARLSFAESGAVWFGSGGVGSTQLAADAAAQAAQALAQQPDLVAAQLARGYSAYWGRQDFSEALKAFAAVLKLQPNNADAIAAIGYVQRRQGHYDAAIDSLQRALVLDPRDSGLTDALAETYAATSRYAEAEQYYRRALALDPNNFPASSDYSEVILLGSGNVQRALAVAQGDHPILQVTRVQLLTYQRKYRDALALLDVIPDTPDNFTYQTGPKALFQADLYRLAGDTAQAQPLYAQALAQSRVRLAALAGKAIKLSYVWNFIAAAELGLGQTDAGLASIAKSQALATQSGDIFFGTGFLMYADARLYGLAGRPDLAMPLLESLATSGTGWNYSPVMLWLDPAWDPIRHDPRFEALQKKYASAKPAAASSEATP